jgi:hypothetical protein
MSWYQTGNEGEKAIKNYEEDRANSAAGIFRLWLPPGGSTQFTFLDSAGFYFKEHNYYHNRSWLNWETCIQDIPEFPDCPFCEAGVRVYYECVFTIIDHSQWESKKKPGTIIKDTKKLLVLRSTARKKVLRKMESMGGDLTGVRMSTNRDDAKECSTGEDFEIIRFEDGRERYSREELMAFAPAEYAGKPVDPAEWIKPFDYKEIFAPRSAEALSRILGRIPAAGAGDAPSRSASSNNSNTEGSKPTGDGKSAPSVNSLING